jgi:hypothetical protein
MSAASDYLENALLDHVLGGATYTQPTTLYVGLFTGTPNTNLEAGTLTDEVSGGNYTRKAVTFSAASSGSTSNSATVTFDTATANWGTITSVAVMDSVTGGAGNVLFYGSVTASKTIESGDTFQIASGNLSISLA